MTKHVHLPGYKIEFIENKNSNLFNIMLPLEQKDIYFHTVYSITSQNVLRFSSLICLQYYEPIKLD